MGHEAYYGIDKYFSKKVRYITFLRDPFDILYSVYNSRRYLYDRGRTKYISRHFYESNSEFIGFKKFIFESEFSRNYICGFLFKLLGRKRRIVRTKKELDFILKILNKFYFIGLFENIEEDLDIILRLFEVPNDYLILNKITNDEGILMNSLDKKKFLSRNQIDYLLYHHAIYLNKKFKLDNN